LADGEEKDRTFYLHIDFFGATGNAGVLAGSCEKG
jgi:hypothetical protein